VFLVFLFWWWQWKKSWKKYVQWVKANSAKYHTRGRSYVCFISAASIRFHNRTKPVQLLKRILHIFRNSWRHIFYLL
jgi:hypothetical protein